MRARFQPVQVLDRVDPLEAERALLADRGNRLDRRERRVALGRVGDVGVEQGEVELHVQRFLVQLARQVHARLGRVDVLVQVEHQVVRHDGVAGGEKRHQPLDQVAVRGRHLRAEVGGVHREIDFLHRPGVLDRVAVHLVERRIAHRPQRQFEAGVEDLRVAGRLGGHGCSLRCVGRILLPAGEGAPKGRMRVRFAENRARPNPHPSPLPEGEGARATDRPRSTRGSPASRTRRRWLAPGHPRPVPAQRPCPR